MTTVQDLEEARARVVEARDALTVKEDEIHSRRRLEQEDWEDLDRAWSVYDEVKAAATEVERKLVVELEKEST